MSSNFNKLYIDGLWTQWAFYRGQEHPKRSSLLSSILILIFLPFTCSHYSLLRIYYSFHYALCTMHYTLCIIYFALCTMHYLYVFIRIHYSHDEI